MNHFPPRTPDPSRPYSTQPFLEALEEREAVIRALNDTFRKTFDGSQIHCSPGILDLPFETQERIVQRIRRYRNFSSRTDPEKLHNRGRMEVGQMVIHWEIHCFNLDLSDHSPDPANPIVSRRYLLVMLAEESGTDLPKIRNQID